ncbi:MAG: SAM-dependent methyltransferase [Gammaproteobacteria bacterium RIFCSPHIGHO2_12_FULL_38_11]|nr:MAG: SAM-dependent methyltransferase [Gammaproteobacteria bacterium RIFCSPHIGHO2_12_FULL_38_11]
MSYNIAISYTSADLIFSAKQLSNELNLPLTELSSQDYAAFLIVTSEHLELKIIQKKLFTPLFIDFLQGALNHRRHYGGGKNQLIAKAVGIKAKQKPVVLDVTAGLGRDAFVLATLGCDVTMCERSPIIYALLHDGLLRAQKEVWFQQLSLKLNHVDALNYLSKIADENKPDVIYIDPMFPEKTKSALVKKEMRILRDMVGDDADSEKLLQAALKIAKKRVVVKRARLAPLLSDEKPDIVFEGRSSRFDVYLI